MFNHPSISSSTKVLCLGLRWWLNHCPIDTLCRWAESKLISAAAAYDLQGAYMECLGRSTDHTPSNPDVDTSRVCPRVSDSVGKCDKTFFRCGPGSGRVQKCQGPTFDAVHVTFDSGPDRFRRPWCTIINCNCSQIAGLPVAEIITKLFQTGF
jgi:hypothetical protein